MFNPWGVAQQQQTLPALRPPGFGDLAGQYAPNQAGPMQQQRQPQISPGFMSYLQNPHVKGIFDAMMDVGTGMTQVQPGSGDLSPISLGMQRGSRRIGEQEELQRGDDFRSYLHSRMGEIDTSTEQGMDAMTRLQALYAYSEKAPGLIPSLLNGMNQGNWMEKMNYSEALRRSRPRAGDQRRFSDVQTANNAFLAMEPDVQQSILESPQNYSIYMEKNGHLLFDPTWGILRDHRQRLTEEPKESGGGAWSAISGAASGLVDYFVGGDEPEAPAAAPTSEDAGNPYAIKKSKGGRYELK